MKKYLLLSVLLLGASFLSINIVNYRTFLAFDFTSSLFFAFYMIITGICMLAIETYIKSNKLIFVFIASYLVLVVLLFVITGLIDKLSLNDAFTMYGGNIFLIYSIFIIITWMIVNKLNLTNILKLIILFLIMIAMGELLLLLYFFGNIIFAQFELFVFIINFILAYTIGTHLPPILFKKKYTHDL